MVARMVAAMACHHGLPGRPAGCSPAYWAGLCGTQQAAPAETLAGLCLFGRGSLALPLGPHTCTHNTSPAPLRTIHGSSTRCGSACARPQLHAAGARRGCTGAAAAAPLLAAAACASWPASPAPDCWASSTIRATLELRLASRSACVWAVGRYMAAAPRARGNSNGNGNGNGINNGMPERVERGWGGRSSA